MDRCTLPSWSGTALRRGTGAFALAGLAGLGGLAPAAQAQSALFKDADLKLGERLLAENRCSGCHAQRVGGDGSAIYRPQGRIHSPSGLRTMVQYCSTELNLQLFPEDVDAIAAVLDRDHYHFR